MSDEFPQLSADKRALLARELARRRAGAAAITARPRGDPPPLSLAQRRLWLLDRMSPGQPTYNATLTIRLEGALDAGALHAALDTVVERHESLRTVGVEHDGVPEGRLLDRGVRWRTAVTDETGLPQLLRADAREPFDLSTDVMLRASLYRVHAELHVLILVLHHIASDGWSRGVLFGELTEAYNAHVERREPQLRPLAIQYGDYAKWQHDAVASGRMLRHEEFWRQELAGADFVVNLPYDLTPDGAQDHLGERIAMDGPPGSGDAIRLLGRAEGATFFMAMLAASGALLFCLTEQEDIVLGSPVANRQRPELEGLIGFFVNTVVLRVRLGGDPSFRELLRRCRQTAISCLAHQDMPFDRLVEIINPRRISGRNPLFQVNYRMQGIAPPPPQLTGLKVSRMLTETGTARFNLALGVVDQPDALRGYIEYSSSLFRPSTPTIWQAELVNIVVWAAQDPEIKMSVLRRRVLADLERARAAVAARSAQSRRPIRRG